jgi:hypothetical protein
VGSGLCSLEHGTDTRDDDGAKAAEWRGAFRCAWRLGEWDVGYLGNRESANVLHEVNLQRIHVDWSAFNIQDCELQSDDLAFLMLKRHSRQDFQGVTETERARRSRVGDSDLGSCQSRRCYWSIEGEDSLSVDLYAGLVLDANLDFLSSPRQISAVQADVMEVDPTYDCVLISRAVFDSILLGPIEGTSGTCQLNGEHLVYPERFQLGFGSLDFFNDFERDKESRGLQGQDTCN